MKLEKCHGSNLLNHLKQKNIEIDIEQYLFLSEQDLSLVETEEVEVSTLKNDDYITVFTFNSENRRYDVSYLSKEQEKMRKLNIWRTKITFQGETYYSLGYSKKNSLFRALESVESKIRDYIL